jgi:hypothetical protein
VRLPPFSAPADPHGLVGKRVNIIQEDDSTVEGMIVDFNPADQTHAVLVHIGTADETCEPLPLVEFPDAYEVGMCCCVCGFVSLSVWFCVCCLLCCFACGLACVSGEGVLSVVGWASRGGVLPGLCPRLALACADINMSLVACCQCGAP